MHTRTNIAMTSLAALWIMTGLFFGGLSFLGATPTQQAPQVHNEPLKANFPGPWTHARVSSAASRV